MATSVVATAIPTTPKGIAALLQIDFDRIVREYGEERPREYTYWCNTRTMTHAEDKALQVVGLGTMQTKAIGGAFPKDNLGIGGQNTQVPVPYGSAVEHTFEGYRDEQYGVIDDMVAEQTKGGRHREEVAGVAVWERAFNTAYTGFNTGESLCDTHTNADGTTTRNRPTTDVGFGTLFVQQAIFHFHGLKNERGRPMLLHPSMMFIHYNNLMIAREILGSPGKPYTTDNEINALIQEELSYMVLHFLTSTTACFATVEKENTSIELLWRDAPMSDAFDDQWTKGFVTTLYQRHTDSFYRSWRGIYGSPGA